MKDKYYLNGSTGEITESHREAVEWYRAGDRVEIWSGGKCVLTWEF